MAANLCSEASRPGMFPGRLLINVCWACVLLGLSVAAVIETGATSYLITLEQRVARSKLILRVTVTETSSPQTSRLLVHAICKAKVLEVLKGPTDMKELEFHGTAYGTLAPEKLPQLIGKEFYVFLHESELPGGQWWVYDRVLPIANEYTEWRSVDGRSIAEKYSRSNYVARIRTLAGTDKQR